jgi:circadian clock protein KaiC
MTELEPDTGGNDNGEIERLPSLVPGLDTILCGGFLRGGLYIIQGPPGTGKTILASQIIYTHAAQGRRALFITVLGENHGRMMQHLRPMRFFDPSLVPEPVTYINAFQALEDEGLKGLSTLFRREVQACGATLLILDGLSAVKAKASTDAIFEMKRFTHELQTLASATNCTMLLLTTMSGGPGSAPELTMVDGVIQLQQRIYGLRSERRLVVQKFRGSGFLEGEHAYRISRDGLTVFPRIEAQFAMPTRRVPPRPIRVSSGIASLDVMLHGGLPVSTVGAVVGASGAGKTTLGLQFLAASSASEPGLLFGCYEPPERLLLKAEIMGFDLAAAEQRGDVEFLWYPTGEHVLDELAHRLLDAVRRRGVKRLVIDGISGFQQAALEPERIVRFWSALCAELRALDVTTLHTMELPEFMGPELRLPVGGVSSLAETLLLLRYVEIQSRLYRLISLFKVREGAFDPAIRKFEITDTGLVVGQPFEGIEGVLSGIAREVVGQPTLLTPESGDGKLSIDDGQLG